MSNSDGILCSPSRSYMEHPSCGPPRNTGVNYTRAHCGSGSRALEHWLAVVEKRLVPLLPSQLTLVARAGTIPVLGALRAASSRAPRYLAGALLRPVCLRQQLSTSWLSSFASIHLWPSRFAGDYPTVFFASRAVEELSSLFESDSC